MDQQQGSKPGRFRRWRERRRAKADRAGEINRRIKAARGETFDRNKRSSGGGPPGVGPGAPFGGL
jgi:hypothetical protein